MISDITEQMFICYKRNPASSTRYIQTIDPEVSEIFTHCGYTFVVLFLSAFRKW